MHKEARPSPIKGLRRAAYLHVALTRWVAAPCLFLIIGV